MSDGIIVSESVPEKQPVSIGSKVKGKMPPGKGRYTVGAKGTHGCKGFPVVGGEGKVHGCHTTRSAAMRQQAAIYASQNQKKLADTILDLAKAQEMLENFTNEGDFVDDMMERMDKANSISTGDMVSWGSSGGTARGKVIRVIRNGKYNVPSSDFTITGTPDDPAVAIRVYRDGKPTDTIVGHKMSTLRSMGKSIDTDPQILSDSSVKDDVPKNLSEIFSNPPKNAKRVNTTGNARINLNLFREEK